MVRRGRQTKQNDVECACFLCVCRWMRGRRRGDAVGGRGRGGVHRRGGGMGRHRAGSGRRDRSGLIYARKVSPRLARRRRRRRRRFCRGRANLILVGSVAPVGGSCRQSSHQRSHQIITSGMPWRRSSSCDRLESAAWHPGTGVEGEFSTYYCILCRGATWYGVVICSNARHPPSPSKREQNPLMSG